MVDPSLLSDVQLFRDFADDDVAVVADTAVIRKLARNELLFGQEDPAAELFVVQQGRLAIASKSVDGRESLVALMESGDLVGELSFFDGRGRSAEARALEPTEVICIPFAPVREVLERRPALLWGMVELLAGRLRTTDEALADSVFLDVPGRTAKRLLELAGEADEFQLPLTQEELAGLVGASRERVNKAIASFLRLGWIEQADRRYRILDREQLTRRAR